MSDKSAYEVYVTRIWRDPEGKRQAERKQLQVPWYLALRRYDRLSDLQIREGTTDLMVELERRESSA